MKRRMTAYIYGDLSPRERAAVEQHVARCAACRAVLEQTREALALMPREPAPPLAEAEREEMMRSVRRAIRTAAVARERARRWAWSWTAAVVVAGAVGAGLWITQRGPSPRPLVAQGPTKQAPAGPELAAGGAERPEASEAPRLLTVADVEIEFVTRAAVEPTSAPAPAGDNDMRMTP
jgi:anti-sigma factor RsiW